MAKQRKRQPMTGHQYRTAAAELDLSLVGLSRVLGIGWRQSQRYADGDSPVPAPVEQLVRVWIDFPETRHWAADKK